MDNDFDSVSWQNDEAETDTSRPNTAITAEPGEPVYGANSSGKRKVGHSSNQAGEQADAVDLAGIGEARLDLKVDTPLKENDGTKDAYVSYLVTTHVRSPLRYYLGAAHSLKTVISNLKLHRPTSNPLQSLHVKSGDVSRISSFFTNNCPASIPNALSLLCPINTKWNMSEAIVSALISPSVALILFTDFLDG